MNCEFSNRIDAYHDGEVGPAEAAQIETHLAGCATCAAKLESLRAIARLFDGAAIPSLSPAGRARLHAAVDGEIEKSSERLLMPLARSLVGIAAAVLIFATVGLLRLAPHHPAAPQQWEGAMLVPQTATADPAGADSSQSNNAIEANLIVADLSRGSQQSVAGY